MKQEEMNLILAKVKDLLKEEVTINEVKENDTIEFVESLNYKEYKETISNIDFSEYSILTIKDK